MTPIYLRSMQAVVTAVQQRSFNAAAEVLGITPAAVGQRVKALEDYLGIELLTRGRDGIRPTNALEAALPDLHRGFEALASAMDELEFQRQQEIYISAPPDLAVLWLEPRLVAIRQAHPQISIYVNGVKGSSRRDYTDCEISFGQSFNKQHSDLLFRDYILPIGSPLNVERLSRADPDSWLEGFPLLHISFYEGDPADLSWVNWVKEHAIQRTAPERGMRFQSVIAVLNAVGADAGLALCGVGLVQQQLEDGEIGLPFTRSSGLWSAHGVTAHYRSDGLNRTHLQRFREWLVEEGEKTSQWVKQFAEH